MSPATLLMHCYFAYRDPAPPTPTDHDATTPTVVSPQILQRRLAMERSRPASVAERRSAPRALPTVEKIDTVLRKEIDLYVQTDGDELVRCAGVDPKSNSAIENDCLVFWETKYAQTHFPVLRVLARMLVGPASSAESERSGSKVENWVTAKRCSMRPTLLSAMTFQRGQGFDPALEKE